MVRRSETRVGDFSVNYAETPFFARAQVADPHQREGPHNYEIAPEVHVYLYASSNPVSGIDPTGYVGDFSLASLSAAQSIGALVGAIAVVSVFHFTQTMPLGGELIDNNPLGLAAAAHAISATTELLESNYESVRDQLKKAVAAVAATATLSSRQKFVPVSMSITPTIAAHVAIRQGGVPQMLTRVNRATTIRNRAEAIGPRGPAGFGLSWDEYPFASTRQGGAGASVIPVPQMENWKQGGIIGAAYLIENINVGDDFWAVVVP